LKRPNSYYESIDILGEYKLIPPEFAYEFAKALNRPGIPQGFITMSSGQGGRNRQLASPLS